MGVEDIGCTEYEEVLSEYDRMLARALLLALLAPAGCTDKSSSGDTDTAVWDVVGPSTDNDNDGWAPCEPGEDCAFGDCDDEDNEVHPYADEVCDDSVDQDCDDLVDEGCSDTGSGRTP